MREWCKSNVSLVWIGTVDDVKYLWVTVDWMARSHAVTNNMLQYNKTLQCKHYSHGKCLSLPRRGSVCRICILIRLKVILATLLILWSSYNQYLSNETTTSMFLLFYATLTALIVSFLATEGSCFQLRALKPSLSGAKQQTRLAANWWTVLTKWSI